MELPMISVEVDESEGGESALNGRVDCVAGPG